MQEVAFVIVCVLHFSRPHRLNNPYQHGIMLFGEPRKDVTREQQQHHDVQKACTVDSSMNEWMKQACYRNKLIKLLQ